MKRLLAISVAFAALSGTAEAASIAFEGFNYSGTVTKYTSESDAVAGINGSSYAIPTSTNGANSTLPGARDAQVWADTDTGLFYLSTLWYYNPPEYSAQADGYGNPNNTNTGFLQLYDDSGANALNMAWSNGNKTFNVAASGSNSSTYARLWPAPTEGGAASISGGTFLNYSMDMQASFADAAMLSGGDLVNDVQPTGVSGRFTALFHNTGSSVADNGFYSVDLVLGAGSAAQAGQYTYQGVPFDESASSSFVAPVPVPAALPLLLGGLGFLGFTGRRRGRV